MAECHPVGFQWVMEAKARGATVIHVDPRFTRTSAVADLHVPLRAGTDIALPRRDHQLRACSNEKYFREYVLAYTNAATIIGEDFRDTEDLDGVFSGFDPEEPALRPAQLAVRGRWRCRPRPGERDQEYDDRAAARSSRPAGRRAASRTAPAAPAWRRRTPSGTRRCSTRAASSRSSSGTSPGTPPEMVEQVCGVPPDAFRQVCELLHRELRPRPDDRLRLRVGWTQHTVGVQYIRTASILQPLLGNIGRPGRRHPGAARARLHPGLHRHPDAVQPAARLHPDAARARQRGPGRVRRGRGHRRRASGRTCAPTR